MKEKENTHAEYDNSIKDHRKPKYLFRFGIFCFSDGVWSSSQSSKDEWVFKSEV